MNSFLTPRKRLAFLVSLVVAGAVTIAAYAALPSRTIDPNTVPAGTLAGATSLDVLSVDSFTRAINQAHGTNGTLQHIRFAPGASSGWHSHPGPNMVFVVGGSITLTDEHCNVTTYTDGQGFVTGLNLHTVTAGPNGADTYQVNFLPADATETRDPPLGQSATPPICAR